MSSFASSSRGLSAAVVLLAGGALAACSVSSGSTATAAASASPGSVPQVGQIIASAPLSSGGYEASRCGGRDDVAREALRLDALARGWTIDVTGADDRGCVSWGSVILGDGQRASLAVEEDQGTGTASLRVVDVVPSSTAGVVAPTRSASASAVAPVGVEN